MSNNDKNLSALTAVTSPLATDLLYTVRAGSPNLPRKIRAGDLLGNFASALWFNVKAPVYGATGDGTTMDRLAIQAALDAANAAGGGIVYFPVGTYRIDDYLSVYSNTMLLGTGHGSNIFTTSTVLTAIPFESAFYSTSMSALIYLVHDQSNMRVSNLWVKGAWVSGASTITHNILVGLGTSNCTLDHNWIDNSGWSGTWTVGTNHLIYANHCLDCAIDGIELNATTGAVVADNWAIGCGLATAGVGGIEFNAATASLLLIGNYISGGRHGIQSQLQSGSDITIAFNIIVGIGGRGIDVEAVTSATYKNVRIIGNTIRDSTGSGAVGHGIRLGNELSQFQILGNIVTGLTVGSGPSAIVCNGSVTDFVSNGVIAHNICDGNWVNLEIADYSTGISIHSNRLTAPGGTNVSLSANASSISWRNNIGYVTRNFNATSVANGGTVGHGCAVTPTRVNVTPSVSGEMVSVTAIGATTFTVAIIKNDGTAGTTQTVYWEAEKA